MNCIVLMIYGVLICLAGHNYKRVSGSKDAVRGSLVILPGVVEGGKALLEDGGIDENVAHLAACLDRRQFCGREFAM